MDGGPNNIKDYFLFFAQMLTSPPAEKKNAHLKSGENMCSFDQPRTLAGGRCTCDSDKFGQNSQEAKQWKFDSVKCIRRNPHRKDDNGRGNYCPDQLWNIKELTKLPKTYTGAVFKEWRTPGKSVQSNTSSYSNPELLIKIIRDLPALLAQSSVLWHQHLWSELALRRNRAMKSIFLGWSKKQMSMKHIFGMIQNLSDVIKTYF